MRSHRLRSRTAQRGVAAEVRRFDRAISPSGLRHRAHARATRAALLGSVCIGALAMLVPGTAHAVDGTWTGAAASEWTTGTNWSSAPKHRARQHGDVHQQRGPHVGHHLEQHLDQHHRSSTPRHRPIRSPFRTGPPSRSTTARRSTSNFSVNSGATLAIGERRLRRDRLAGGRRHLAARRVRSHHPPDHRGKHQHHVLGRHSRAPARSSSTAPRYADG